MLDRASEPEEAALPAGTVLGGRYRVLGVLGRGGMGVVYRAEHIALKREVALKTLHAGMLRDPSAAPRIIREARAATLIEHPGIAHVFDLDSDNGITFLAMERLQGEDLRHRLAREGGLSPKRVAELGVEICDAIAAAHLRGVLHRDLTPRNIFLATDALGLERVKILDFGVAKLLGPPRDGGATESARVFGTLAYMAPERLSGETDVADERSDLYAIGVILYEALVGAPAFEGRNSAELSMRVAFERPAPLRSRRADLSSAFAAVIERAMQREPARRFSTAAEMAGALRAMLPQVEEGSGQRASVGAETATRGPRQRRSSRRTRSAWLALALVGALLCLGAASWYAGTRPTSIAPQPIAKPGTLASAPVRTTLIAEPPAPTAAAHAIALPLAPPQSLPPAPPRSEKAQIADAPPARARKRPPRPTAPPPASPEEELPPLLPR